MEKKIEFDTIKDGIKFKIKRPKKDTFVMAIPYDSNYPGLHIIYNGNKPFQNHYDWGSSREKIYLCNCNSTPSFYFKSGQNYLKITLDEEDNISFLPLTKTSEINTYYKSGEYCVSSASDGWGIFIYDIDVVDGKKLEEKLMTRKKYDLLKNYDTTYDTTNVTPQK